MQEENLTTRRTENFSMISLRGTGLGKCPKILTTNVSDKMAYANSADPDQTAPAGAV